MHAMCCRGLAGDATVHECTDLEGVVLKGMQEAESAGCRVHVTDKLTSEDFVIVRDRLADFNSRSVSGIAPERVGLLAKVDDEIVAGASGLVGWGWAFLEYLWVCESLRFQGLGSQLLRDFEANALNRGCAAIWLDTFSFQAPDFYVKHSYREFARLSDYPPGGSRRFLWKPLAGSFTDHP